MTELIEYIPRTWARTKDITWPGAPEDLIVRGKAIRRLHDLGLVERRRLCDGVLWRRKETAEARDPLQILSRVRLFLEFVLDTIDKELKRCGAATTPRKEETCSQ